jgi:hypothetical protein
MLADGLTELDGLWLSELDADGETELDGLWLREVDEASVADAEADGETELDGLLDSELEADGETLADASPAGASRFNQLTRTWSTSAVSCTYRLSQSVIDATSPPVSVI